MAEGDGRVKSASSDPSRDTQPLKPSIQYKKSSWGSRASVAQRGILTHMHIYVHMRMLYEVNTHDATHYNVYMHAYMYLVRQSLIRRFHFSQDG